MNKYKIAEELRKELIKLKGITPKCKVRVIPCRDPLKLVGICNDTYNSMLLRRTLTVKFISSNYYIHFFETGWVLSPENVDVVEEVVENKFKITQPKTLDRFTQGRIYVTKPMSQVDPGIKYRVAILCTKSGNDLIGCDITDHRALDTPEDKWMSSSFMELDGDLTITQN